MRKVHFWTGFFEIISFFLLVVIIVFFALSYENLPALSQGPAGKGDARGAKVSICLLFVMGFVIYGLLFALKRFPRLMSYPVPITPQNLDYQARIGKLMLSILTFCSMGMILVILYDLYQSAVGQADGHVGIVLGLLAVCVIDVAAYTVIAKKKEKDS